MTHMGFLTEDGLHEGYLVPLFHDGQRGLGITGGPALRGRIIVGHTKVDDGERVELTRPAGEVTGWIVCCDCYTHSRYSPSTWTGPVFTRVPSQALENIAARKIFAQDDDVADASYRPEVEDAARELWRLEHTFGTDAITEVEAAANAVEQAKLRLDAAVALARSSGASWADIGRSTGMTRQSAQERWR